VIKADRDGAECLGLQPGTVRVVRYDSRWPGLYAAEADRIRRAAATSNVAVLIEHMGSTAVPGLPAKPVLDILVGYRSPDSRSKAVEAIVGAGYIHRGEQGIPGRDFFRRGQPRQYHVHLTLIDSMFWRDQRTFRDYLRSHAEAATTYAELKERLAGRFPNDREAYTEGKAEFIRAILMRARQP